MIGVIGQLNYSKFHPLAASSKFRTLSFIYNRFCSNEYISNEVNLSLQCDCSKNTHNPLLVLGVNINPLCVISLNVNIRQYTTGKTTKDRKIVPLGLRENKKTYGWDHHFVDEEGGRHDRFSLLGRTFQSLVLNNVDMVA